MQQKSPKEIQISGKLNSQFLVAISLVGWNKSAEISIFEKKLHAKIVISAYNVVQAEIFMQKKTKQNKEFWCETKREVFNAFNCNIYFSLSKINQATIFAH